jgi:hypothetical protein
MEKYVTLRYKNGEKYVCNTVKKAIGSLFRLGFHADWAILVENKEVFYFIYQGFTHPITYEAQLDLPADGIYSSASFKELLQRMFSPFLQDTTDLRRSIIEVHEYRSSETGNIKYAVNLFLIFKKNRKILETLKNVADGFREMKATYFALD